MSETQNKSNGEQQQQAYAHQPLGSSPYPPMPGGYPPYYAYPPPPADANGHPDPNGHPGAPPGAYMMPMPHPGMMYAYPGQAYPPMPFPTSVHVPPALSRPKRKQVKMACTNCAAACKRCDEGRPCERCIKYGIADTCADGSRKERKKGIKRGPYKRKGKIINPETGYEVTYEHPGEWPPGTGQGGPPEGYFPYYYPGPGFIPVGPDGQPIQPDGSSSANGQGGMPHGSYYSMHPAMYPPFSPYGHAPPGSYAPMMPGQMPMPHPPQQASAEGSGVDPNKTTSAGPRGDNQEEGTDGGASPRAKGKKRGKVAHNGDDGEYAPKSNKKGKASTVAARLAAVPVPVVDEGSSTTAKETGQKNGHSDGVAEVTEGDVVPSPVERPSAPL